MTPEQKKARKQLTAENKKIITRMERNLETYYLNELEYERTISDLIGMALECQERGDSFSDSIGDCSSFCRELVANLPGQSKGEKALEFLRWLLWCVTLLVPVLYALSFFVTFFPSRSESIYIYASVVFLCKYLAVTLVLVFGLFYVKRNVYHPQSLVWSLYFIILLLTFFAVEYLPLDSIPDVEVKINIILWALISAAVLLAVSLAKRVIARKHARRIAHDRKEDI
jgi:uncharacterized membrane-anchored protein